MAPFSAPAAFRACLLLALLINGHHPDAHQFSDAVVHGACFAQFSDAVGHGAGFAQLISDAIGHGSLAKFNDVVGNGSGTAQFCDAYDVVAHGSGAAPFSLADGYNSVYTHDSGAAPFRIAVTLAAPMYADVDTHGSGTGSFTSSGTTLSRGVSGPHITPTPPSLHHAAPESLRRSTTCSLHAKVGAALLTSIASFRVRSPHFGLVLLMATLIPVAAANDDFPLPVPPPPPPSRPVDDKPPHWRWIVAGGCLLLALAVVAAAVGCYRCCKRGLQAANAAANTV